MTKLTYLGLHGNKKITAKGLEALAKVLQEGGVPALHLISLFCESDLMATAWTALGISLFIH